MALCQQQEAATCGNATYQHGCVSPHVNNVQASIISAMLHADVAAHLLCIQLGTFSLYCTLQLPHISVSQSVPP